MLQLMSWWAVGVRGEGVEEGPVLTHSSTEQNQIKTKNKRFSGPHPTTPPQHHSTTHPLVVAETRAPGPDTATTERGSDTGWQGGEAGRQDGTGMFM